MSATDTTMSARAVRLRARGPRVLFYGLSAILCLVGLRTLIAGPPKPSTVTQIVRAGPTVATTAFAESFARAYLTWPADGSRDVREQQLAPFLSRSLSADAGVRPGSGVTQSVQWARSVTARSNPGGPTMVTVAAQTSAGLVYLAVPVATSAAGFLSVVSYPSIVGGPAVDHSLSRAVEDRVEDDALTVVVRRALGNYLGGSDGNLRADLAPDAVISLPGQRLTVASVDPPTWVVVGRRVATEVTATDDRSTTYTLRYELDVERRDRWYVRSLTVEPTTKESS